MKMSTCLDMVRMLVLFIYKMRKRCFMFSVIRKIRETVRNMRPAMIREIIVIIILLAISVMLSLPQYRQDMEELRIWNENHKNTETEE